MKFNAQSSEIHDDINDYNVNINKKHEHEEDERNQYAQYTIKQLDNDNDKQNNRAHSTKEEDDDVVVNCIEQKKTLR
ncbi:unnamed protein product [Rotaria sp. Silwood2]|nr:unnamed protein product [Rotaria sp. Silwood2]CAF3422081.1 unnamed protein product [Rotaria sp. Silwood2]CAF4028774.1 unnamed protein product [Rotaria sp. Silwood2]CAF4499619.1 unnamed protein product [Rotaria sp. Silwood2]